MSAGLSLGFRRPSAVPGFAPAFGVAVAGIGLLVLLPLAALVVRAAGQTWAEFAAAFSDRALAAYHLSFGAPLLAAGVSLVVGVLLPDEPFGALDAKVRRDLRRWLRELHHRLRHA